MVAHLMTEQPTPVFDLFQKQIQQRTLTENQKPLLKLSDKTKKLGFPRSFFIEFL